MIHEDVLLPPGVALPLLHHDIKLPIILYLIYNVPPKITLFSATFLLGEESDPHLLPSVLLSAPVAVNL